MRSRLSRLFKDGISLKYIQVFISVTIPYSHFSICEFLWLYFCYKMLKNNQVCPNLCPPANSFNPSYLVFDWFWKKKTKTTTLYPELLSCIYFSVVQCCNIPWQITFGSGSSSLQIIACFIWTQSIPLFFFACVI